MQIIQQNSELGHNQGSMNGLKDENAPIYHIIRLLEELRIRDAAPSRPHPQFRPLPSPPQLPPYQEPYVGGYPTHIMDTYRHLPPIDEPHILSDEMPFYPLWRQVLAYWFPSFEGFTLAQDWFLSTEQLPGLPATEPASFAVLVHGQPILLVRLSWVTDFETLATRSELRSGANRLFDSTGLWCGHPALCVISAVGAKWNAFLRPTDMTSADAENVLGYDWYGEWKEDVVSDESYRALRQYFKVLKASVSGRS